MSYHSIDTEHPFNGRIQKQVSPLWVVASFIVAYCLNIIGSAINALWMPDFLALTLLYWTIRFPRHVGMTIAFICGLFMDVHNGSVLGQQALGYVVLSYLAFAFHRRLPWFASLGQILHIVPFLFIAQLVVLAVRLWLDGLLPDPIWFLSSLTGGLLWPIVGVALSWPERRRPSDNTL